MNQAGFKALAEAFRGSAAQYSEAIRRIGEVFKSPAMQLTATRLEALRTAPLPLALQVWESEGGAAGHLLTEDGGLSL